jgi:hypothetical protein
MIIIFQVTNCFKKEKQDYALKIDKYGLSSLEISIKQKIEPCSVIQEIIEFPGKYRKSPFDFNLNPVKGKWARVGVKLTAGSVMSIISISD